MKASTLFVICIALLVGLGAVGTAQFLGIFKKNSPVVDSAVKSDPILVLVAVSDLPAGVAITSNDVRVRELYPNERELYEQNRGNFMPAFVSAAHLRTPTQKINADVPLLRKYFKEDQPAPFSTRLSEGMRGANVSVPKERCAGGLIQVGEYVDVLLTTKINDAVNPSRQFIKTATVARQCRVIAKRNNLRSMMQADADGSSIPFGLETNPYRAALIEFAQHKGQITLVPVPMPNADILNPLPVKNEMATMSKGFSDMTSPEYRDEDQRVEQMNQGIYAIGDEDLVRIFRIAPPPSKIPPTKVVRVRGVTPTETYIFSNDPRSNAGDTTPQVVPYGGPQGGGQSFNNPVGSNNPNDPNYCPTCDQNKNKQANGAAMSMGAPAISASFSSPR